MRKTTAPSLLAMLMALAIGFVQPAQAGSISVESPWARASAGMAKAGAAFMTISNSGEADRLVAAKADVSAKAELHTHIMDGGVMKMREVPGIDVPAAGKAVLEPGGHHVMFMGLKAPLKEGESFPLTLVFEKAGEVQTTVSVMGPGAMGPGANDKGAMGNGANDKGAMGNGEMKKEMKHGH